MPAPNIQIDRLSNVLAKVQVVASHASVDIARLKLEVVSLKQKNQELMEKNQELMEKMAFLMDKFGDGDESDNDSNIIHKERKTEKQRPSNNDNDDIMNALKKLSLNN